MKRKAYWLVLLPMILLLPVARDLLGQTDALSIPQLALGGGYECVVIVTNRTGSNWRGTGQLRTGDAADWQGDWEITGSLKVGESSFSIELGPHATRRIELTGDSNCDLHHFPPFANTRRSNTGLARSG